MTLAMAAHACLALVPLAFRPLFEPLDVDAFWIFLLLPLVVVISVVYKAIKIDDLADLPRQTAVLALQIVVFMLLAAATLWMVTELV